MNNIIEQMLSKYEIKNVTDEINALKEIIQEIVLLGLSRSGFFDKTAFYGGTALRIFYKLDRFSRSRYDSSVNRAILLKNGVKLISATENISDAPEGILLDSVLVGLAEYYSVELSKLSVVLKKAE